MIRKFAAVAVVAGVMLGTAGCNMITHIASDDAYSASDGANGSAGDVDARNFLLLEDGTKSVLIGSLVNSGSDAAAIQLGYNDGGTDKSAQVNLNGGQKFDLGYNGTAALPVVTTVKPGGIVTVTIGVGSEKATLSVPVLDGTFPEYKAILDGTN
jgi:hypothetical protein